jgi:hypothetical protein
MFTKKIVISSHNIHSRTLRSLAKSLSERVGYRVFRVVPSRVRGRRAVHFTHGLDKREQFAAFKQHGVSSPDYCTSPGGIGEFDGRLVVARHLTNSCEGRGITIFNREDIPPPAPLYTEYIPKKKEFRVHIWNNEVVDVSEKRKRKGFEETRNTQIRNTANGYVFCRTGVIEPTDLRPVACDAVRALGRTYGAVDVIWNEKRNKCFVLEVNARPGIEGTTLNNYVNAILKGFNYAG